MNNNFFISLCVLILFQSTNVVISIEKDKKSGTGSEALEGGPVVVDFCRSLDRVGQVVEQVEAGPFLDRVDGCDVIGETVTRVYPVLKPKSDGGCGLDLRPVPFDLEDSFPVIVSYRYFGRIGPRLIGSCLNVIDGFISSNLPVRWTGNYIDDVGIVGD